MRSAPVCDPAGTDFEKNIGHFMNVEVADAFNRELIAFVGSLLLTDGKTDSAWASAGPRGWD